MAGSSVEAVVHRMPDVATDVKEQEVLPNVDGEEIFKKAIGEKKTQDKATDAEIRAILDGPRGKLELGELLSGRTFRWMVDKIKGILYTPTSEEMH